MRQLSLNNLKATALCLLLLTFLASCGFSLRSNEVISSSYSSLALNLQQPNSEFAQQLRRALLSSNVTLLDSDDLQSISDTPVLSVSAEQVNVQPVTVTPLARAAQYEMRLSVTVSLVLDNQNLIDSENLMVQQVYYEDIENIAGNLGEVELIQTEMRRNLVNQLLRRLEAAEPVALAN